MFIFNKIQLGPFLPRVMLYELILINEIEQRAKIIFLSVEIQYYSIQKVHHSHLTAGANGKPKPVQMVQ